MRKITKKERKKIAGFIILGLSLTLISSPLERFFTTAFTSVLARLVVGIIGLIIVAYLFDITKL